MTKNEGTTRTDGRSSDALRPVTVEVGLQRFPEGSVLYRSGGTSLLVAASAEGGVPDWRAGKGLGWVTAEYAMHPRSGPQRQKRDGRSGRVDGRVQEIQRLIGRSLRACVAMDKLGERSVSIDCDVLDADGGTRTASITGGFIALALAMDSLRRRGLVPAGVIREPVAAVSVGIVRGRPVLDLCYEEDSKAAIDLNVVGTASGGIVEVQGTAEDAAVSRSDFDALVELGLNGLSALFAQQREALSKAGVELDRLFA